MSVLIVRKNLLLQCDEGFEKYSLVPWPVGEAGTSCKVLFAGASRSIWDGWNRDPGLAGLIGAFGWPLGAEFWVAGRFLLKLALSGRLTLEPAIGDLALSAFLLVPITWSAFNMIYKDQVHSIKYRSFWQI